MTHIRIWNLLPSLLTQSIDGLVAVFPMSPTLPVRSSAVLVAVPGVLALSTLAKVLSKLFVTEVAFGGWTLTAVLMVGPTLCHALSRAVVGSLATSAVEGSGFPTGFATSEVTRIRQHLDWYRLGRCVCLGLWISRFQLLLSDRCRGCVCLCLFLVSPTTRHCVLW